MERIVAPAPVKGILEAPSSKSLTQRAIAAALLSDGESTILNPSYCDDSLAAMSIAVGLGAKVEPFAKELKINGAGELKETKLNCGESGLAIRMFSPIAALFPTVITLTGASSLKNRPMKMIAEALNQLGAPCKTDNGFLPISISGPMKGGSCKIDGSVSSQLLTGLLLALPLLPKDSEIHVKNLKSKPYIDMTIQILNEFGIEITNNDYSLFKITGNQKYHARKFEVEGDWSGGAFLLVAGAINGDISVTGLHPYSMQSDVAIIDALQKAGAKISINEKSIDISQSPLRSFEFDATDAPDLFPPLAALASYCKGTSLIKGVSRLANKESDRAVALKEEFGKMNINIEIKNDLMLITGGKPASAHINSHNDHRIAMAAAVTALRASGNIFIKDSQCVSKSYPGFFNDLRLIGAQVFE